MTCSKCGFEAATNDVFCPQCGERLIPEEAPISAFKAKLLPALRDPLFLLMCILMSVSCFFSITLSSLPVIDIIITIFLWLTYAQANKDIADASHLRCVSGALFAEYVLGFVKAGLLLVLGVILTIAFSAINYIIPDPWGELSQIEGLEGLVTFLSSLSGVIFLIICALGAIGLVVFNIFTMRYLHKFVQSLYRSVEQDADQFKYVKAAKVVLFVLGGLLAVKALIALISNDITDCIITAAGCSCYIVAGLLVHKHTK